MNVSAVFLLLVAALFAVVSGLPPVDEFKHNGLFISEKEEPETADEISLPATSEEEVGLRFRRATCDLFSLNTPIGSLNHSACAAHCLALRKGFKGGRCKDGVCHCRK